MNVVWKEKEHYHNTFNDTAFNQVLSELQGKSYAMKREKEQKLSASLFIYMAIT